MAKKSSRTSFNFGANARKSKGKKGKGKGNKANAWRSYTGGK